MTTHENDELEGLLLTIQKVLTTDLLSSKIQYGELTVCVAKESIARALTTLRDHPDCLFKLLLDVCGVDYPNHTERFRVVYHLLSVDHNHRIRVKVAVDELSSVPSVTSIFNTANWFEREVYDLYGIAFTDHPDLRRLLTDYDFEGHPLRKDFPVTGYVEVRYDPAVSKVVYEPVSLQQDYRAFDFISPWEGMNRQPGSKEIQKYTLPGDDKASFSKNLSSDTTPEGKEVQ